MPTILVRVPTKMAFQRVLPLRPTGGLIVKPTKSASPSRCLFGVPDHKEAIRYAREEIKVEQQRLAQKYNYDFENDAPLPGKFQYEKIDRQKSKIADVVVAADVANRLQPESLTEKENVVENTPPLQRSLTDFYTISRKRSCTFDTPKVKFATTTNRVRAAEVACE